MFVVVPHFVATLSGVPQYEFAQLPSTCDKIRTGGAAMSVAEGERAGRAHGRRGRKRREKKGMATTTTSTRADVGVWTHREGGHGRRRVHDGDGAQQRHRCEREGVNARHRSRRDARAR